MYEGLLPTPRFEFLVQSDLRSQTMRHTPLDALTILAKRCQCAACLYNTTGYWPKITPEKHLNQPIFIPLWTTVSSLSHNVARQFYNARDTHHQAPSHND
jgi:hypothetical protein